MKRSWLILSDENTLPVATVARLGLKIPESCSQPLTTAEQVKAELLDQLCNSIQWQRSVEYMVNYGITTFIEIGPGRVLSNLVKRINQDVEILSVGDVPTIKEMVY